jgi:hypothetical protein
MGLNNTDIEILQQIVEEEGDCLNSSRCKKCPFRGTCLPEFIQSKMPSKQKRLQKAEDVLIFHHLLGDDTLQKEEQQQPKRQGSKKQR